MAPTAKTYRNAIFNMDRDCYCQSSGYLLLAIRIDHQSINRTEYIVDLIYSWVYFTWPLRKQAAYKQVTGGPTALNSFPRD